MRLRHFVPRPFPTGLGGNSASAGGQNLAFDAAPAAGDHWGSRLEAYEWASRLEVYETDPDPDMNKWTTQLLFRLAG
jgi:hypothetical protein